MKITHKVYDKNADPNDIFDADEISRLNHHGSKEQYKNFMHIYDAVEKPPKEWMLLAQRIESGEVKPIITHTIHNKNADPYDIFDAGDISRLADYGTKDELESFMQIWAEVDSPPWEWTLLAQRITSGKVKPKRSTRTADRDDELFSEVEKHLRAMSPQRTDKQRRAFELVLKDHPELNFAQLKKAYQRYDRSVYDSFDEIGDIDVPS